jgi:hypothetical protein
MQIAEYQIFKKLKFQHLLIHNLAEALNKKII